jgi:hypothetical protein
LLEKELTAVIRRLPVFHGAFENGNGSVDSGTDELFGVARERDVAEMDGMGNDVPCGSSTL